MQLASVRNCLERILQMINSKLLLILKNYFKSFYMRLAILGTGFISRFYAESLVAQRRKDVVVMVYGRDEAKTKKFAADYNIPNYTTDLTKAVSHPDVEAVVIGLANNV